MAHAYINYPLSCKHTEQPYTHLCFTIALNIYFKTISSAPGGVLVQYSVLIQYLKFLFSKYLLKDDRS